MHLWTEYEGNTLAGYPLGRLTRSEGRSAFFSTTTPDAKPALLRLTESHFDETQLVTRWKQIAAVKHPNLQAIGHFGQLTFDEVPLACCLLEPVDMSLSDVLRERALTVDETREVAEAVAGALASLHAAGLVHEHVDATNVFAHGETVKLRSDCARECTGDFEADTAEARDALRQRDVHDLGLLLLRCLGLEWQGTTASMPIPTPFDRILPRALKGDLTAEGISAAMEALKPAPIPVKPAPLPAATPAPVPSAVASKPSPASTPTKIPAATAGSSPEAVLAAIADRRSTTAGHSSAASAEATPDVTLGKLRNQPREYTETAEIKTGLGRRLQSFNSALSPRVYAAAAAAAVMLGVVLWNTSGSRHVSADQRSTAAPVSSQQMASVAAPTDSSVAKQIAPKPSAAEPRSATFSSGAQAGWRVIAYTYNVQQQAQAKARQIESRYAALHPQVFSPTGHAPYFVALGGPSNAASAMALRDHARHVGLPRDTYARNF